MSDQLGAPGDNTISAGIPTGSGTNSIAWDGSAAIADGTWQTGSR